MCGFRFTRSVWSTALGFSVMMVLDVAMRQNDIAFEVRDYLKTHPNAAVVNLGCWLDSTGRSCDNGNCKDQIFERDVLNETHQL